MNEKITQDIIFNKSRELGNNWISTETKILLLFKKYLLFNEKDIQKWKYKSRRNKNKFKKDVKLIFKTGLKEFKPELKKEIYKINKELLIINEKEITKDKYKLNEREVDNIETFMKKQKKQFNKEVASTILFLRKEMVESQKMLINKYNISIKLINSNVKNLTDSKLFLSDLRTTINNQLQKVALNGVSLGRFQIANYIEVASKETFKKTFLKAQDRRYKEYGVELVVSNVLADSSLICEPYQGEIFAVDGNSSQYASKDFAEGQGLTTHINCRHFWFPFVEGLSVKEKGYSKELIAKNRKNRRKQRAYERQIRKYKRLKLLNKEYQKRINFWEKRLDDLVSKHEGMKRDYRREI